LALILVRHGETDWNRQRRFQATTDVPLNQTGRDQACRIRDGFRQRGLGFATALSSPLARALETATTVLEGTETALSIAPCLSELSLGDYEGQLEADLRERLGEQFETWRAQHFTVPAPCGETVYDGVKRVTAALDALREHTIDQHALVVAHQGILMSVKMAVSGRQDLASVAGFRQRNDQVEAWDMLSGERLSALSFSVATG
jgi:broad specificity phosphatase PhoE